MNLIKNWQEKLEFGSLIILLAIYPIYSNMAYGFTDYQYLYHEKFLNRESFFFNPWQYRVLSPYLIEAIAFLQRKIMNVAALSHDQYFFIFKSLRFVQHLLIFGIALKYYNRFTSNRLLPFLSITALAAGMGAAITKSDLSFNTYFDILFYLIAAYFVSSNKNIAWFLPLTFFAALNRETSLLIPFLLFINFKQFTLPQTRKKYWSVFIGSLLLYALVFIAIRTYYGYEPPAPIGLKTGLPMLQFNFTDTVTILNVFATLSILPLFCLFNIRRAATNLQILFWLVVPAWFALHFWMVRARETRLFLVPLAIVLIPIVLDLVQKSFQNQEMKIRDNKDSI